MAQKENVNEEKIIEFYMHEVLMELDTPYSVYAFANRNNFNESDFYKYFSSFESLEKEIFVIFYSKSIQILLQNEYYETYNPKDKLLSFYHTFFELLSINRSYVFIKLKGNKNKLDSIKLLSLLKKEFIKFVSIEIYPNNSNSYNIMVNQYEYNELIEVVWMQLLFTFQFWLEDESQYFEKTDLFIEKSVKASFDLKEIKPNLSVIDFARVYGNKRYQHHAT